MTDQTPEMREPSTKASPASPPLSMEDIQHLSEEVSSLVRAGLPLEQHLASAGKGRSVRLHKMTELISGQLQQGWTLSDVIAAGGHSGNRMLAAAIAAGVQSGSLATTIETMGDLARDLVRLRQRIMATLSYPVMILAVAWVLVFLVIQRTLTEVYTVGRHLDIPFHPVLETCLRINYESPWIWYIFPAVCVVLFIIWLGSNRTSTLVFRGPELLLLLLPGVWSVIRDLRFYTMSRILSLLVDRAVPLPDALRLAGAVSGSGRLDRASDKAAACIERGDIAALKQNHVWRSGELPPLLAACLSNSALNENQLKLRLQGATDLYHNRLEAGLMWVRSVLPVCIFLVVCGGTLTCYAASVFWPVIEIYNSLGQPR